MDLGTAGMILLVKVQGVLVSGVAGALVALAPILWGAGGIDSGGGNSTTPQYGNHGSVGGMGGVGAAGGYVVRAGLLEVMYSAVRLDPEADSDGNGLPDDWEQEYFELIGVDPAEDADWDGTSNRLEWLAGTDPTDGGSLFRPLVQRDSEELVLTVATLGDRDYRIWGSGDLSDLELLDTIIGDGTELAWSYPLDGTEELPFFLRVEILVRSGAENP